jgi:hypothetical protein
MPLVAALVLASAAAAAPMRTVQDACPRLPPDSALAWTHEQGPDFDVCRAQPRGAQGEVFGVYLGHHPSAHPKASDRLELGIVDGHHVMWYRGADRAHPLDRETVFTAGSPGYRVHIWVHADNVPQLRARMAIVRKLRLP